MSLLEPRDNGASLRREWNCYSALDGSNGRTYLFRTILNLEQARRPWACLEGGAERADAL